MSAREHDGILGNVEQILGRTAAATTTRARTRSLREVLMTKAELPTGRAIPGFEHLTEMTRGLAGLWIVAGAVYSGKTTLVTNIAGALAAPDFPVLYLDMENGTTPDVRCIGERIAGAFGAQSPALDHSYGFRTLAELESELTVVRPPALLIIDTIQEFAQGDDSSKRRGAIDQVLHRMKTLKLSGYTVMLVSQLNDRQSYGHRPTTKDLKETSVLEAYADVVLGVWKARQFDDPRVTVLKVRGAPQPKQEVQLARDGWRLMEAGLRPLRGAVVSEPPKVALPSEPVLRAVARAVEPVTPTEVSKRTKVPLRTVERRLKAYREAGRVEHDARLGMYRMAGTEPALFATYQTATEAAK